MKALQRTESRDPLLSARVVSRRPLRYAGGADPAVDRPAHVRAASGLARVAGQLALVQDDSNFIALVDPAAPERSRSVTLPAGPEGRRQFDDSRGNKRFKLDLEACFATDAPAPLLVAMGSGSSPHRERIVLVEGWERGAPETRLVDAPALYATLRGAPQFAGSELNVEGAVLLGEVLRLFGRGNGARRGTLEPVNATCDLSWRALLAHLRAPRTTSPPTPTSVVRYELGTWEGIPLGFTDAALWGDGILFTAAAEDSPDVTRDGRVAGSVLGVVDRSGAARWTPLADADGAPLAEKVEGVVIGEPGGREALVVVDADRPNHPSELCTVVLDGPWRS